MSVNNIGGAESPLNTLSIPQDSETKSETATSTEQVNEHASIGGANHKVSVNPESLGSGALNGDQQTVCQDSIKGNGGKVGAQEKPKPLPKSPRLLQGDQSIPSETIKTKSIAGNALKPKPLPKPKAKLTPTKTATPKPLPKLNGMKSHKIVHGPTLSSIKIDTSIKQASGKAINDGGVEVKDPEGHPSDAVEAMNRAAEGGAPKPILKGVDQQSKTVEKHDPGKSISEVWIDKKGNSSKETIDRIDTVNNMAKAVEKKIAYLEEKLSEPALDSEGKKGIENEIKAQKKQLEKLQSSGKKWASSDFFRDMLRGNKRLISNNKPEGVISAMNEFGAIMDNKYYSSAPPVNMRNHSCKVLTENGKPPKVENEKTWVRIGVISDMSNGFVNLDSLNELNGLLEDGKLDEATDKRNEMILNITDNWKSSKARKNKNIDAAAGYALRQLGVSDKEILAIHNNINAKLELPKLEVNNNNVNDIQKTVGVTVGKRKDVMAQQFLQLVMQQVENSSAQDLQKGQIKMIHVALLNQNSKSIDGTGWNHDEENQMKDMAAIFAQFDGSKLICDGKGPFIDKEGNIHLPADEKFQEGQKEITLRSLFINQSVQGYVKNNGTTKDLNDKAKSKLPGIGVDKELQGKMDEIFKGEETGFSSAADMIDHFMNAGFKVSTGCLSAKDRTGFVSALMSKRVMRDSNFPESSMNKIMRDQLKPDSPAVKVIIDNTGTKVMKLAPFKLEGITDKFSIKGFYARSATLARQGVEILAEQQRVKQAEKYGKKEPSAA